CGLLLLGIIAGKAVLTHLFQHVGIAVAVERFYWVTELAPAMAKEFLASFHFHLWSVLGPGWFVLVRYLDRGWRSAPFVLPLLGLLGLLLLVFDQTRVLAIVTFPLIFVFWLRDRQFLATLSDRFVGWAVLAWVLIPWLWVFGGKPQDSVLPNDAAVIYRKLLGHQLPEGLAFWPFWYVPATPASAGQEPEALTGFEHTTIDSEPPSGDGCCLDVLAVGDLSGDGRPDILLGSQSPSGWFWYENPTWQRHVIAAGEFTTDGRISDIDGDGRMDAVLSNMQTEGMAEGVAWWQNSGRPAEPDSWRRHPIADFFVHDMLAQDIDGDGRTDLTVFGKNGSRVGVFWLRNPGTPSPPWDLRTIAEGLPGEGLAVADVDGNGTADVVAGHFLFLNDGNGRFAERDLGSICTSGDPADVRPAVADIDGDGLRDIVLAATEGCVGPVAWLAGPGFETRHDIGADPLVGNHSLDIADFDGDGRPDILVGEMHDGGRRVIVYRNVAERAWPATILSRDGTHNARIADLDGDGRPDVVGKNYAGPKSVEAWLNRGTSAAPG
ncbi:MAG TPA: VCBS repeat-containing protein, partial [Mycoplana sp.]|nr:VCBS repeat-containing protein [Mycoplana sp.]